MLWDRNFNFKINNTMSYILINNNQILNGPREWNYRSFESTLLDELELPVKLPMSYDSDEPFIIDDNTRIAKCNLIYQNFNSKIEYLHGPFWDFSTPVVVGSFEIHRYPIEYVKSTLITKVTHNRWAKEIIGAKLSIQGTEVTVDTSRDGRNIFVQQYLLMAPDATVQWKFPEGWLVLSHTELGMAVGAGVAYIQSQFEWEAVTIYNINQCELHEELDLIDVGDPARNMPGMNFPGM